MNLFLLVLLSLIASFVISISPAFGKRKPVLHYCATRYPLVLVHGLGRRENNPLMAYWGELPDILRKSGAVVYICEQDAFGTYRRNGELIRKTVEKAVEESGCEKVNIIAYSKGGIDARYYISALGGEKYAASLVSLAVPHRGTYTAEYLLDTVFDGGSEVEKLLDGIFSFLGERRPDADEALGELTREHMARFNEKYTDSRQVRYFSYAGRISDSYPNPFWKKLHGILFPEEGPNDGFISVHSASWGEFLGVPRTGTQDDVEVSHADIAGISHFSWGTGFDAGAFFRQIAHRLRQEGL